MTRVASDADMPAEAGSEHPAEWVAAQQRTLRTLFASQVLGGLGVAAGIAVGALVAVDVSGSTTLAGLAQTATVLGAAVAAVPLARLMSAHGRRRGLATGYAIGALGAAVTLVAAVLDSFALLLVGLLFFGAATASNMQARYAATDLAAPAHRGRDLSLIVWASTIGTVLGPNLIEPGGSVAGALRLPLLAGPYLFAIVAFGLALLVLVTRLRPDPLLLARHRESGGVAVPAVRGRDVRVALLASPPALLGIGGVVLGHLVMIGLMSMTPVHMDHGGAGLQVVGLVISLHVAGMYALSPVFGWLADRAGRTRVLALAAGLLVGAGALCAVAGPRDTVLLSSGLVLLGLGWSAGLVAGSALLSESLPLAVRTGAQGLSDVAMNVSGAVGGILAGLVVAGASFALLGVAAAVLVAPYLAVAATFAMRSPRAAVAPG